MWGITATITTRTAKEGTCTRQVPYFVVTDVLNRDAAAAKAVSILTVAPNATELEIEVDAQPL